MLEKNTFPDESGTIRAQIRILETTDLHVHILPYDYFADRPAPATGLAKTALLITQARDEIANSLLLDNGDFLQGSPLSDWAVDHNGTVPHPMIAAMNTLNYDGATLGNHEFNYGLGVLKQAINDANFPIVSCNITTGQGPTPSQDTHLTAPWRILPRQITCTDGKNRTLNIGIIGFAPPQIPVWERYTLGDSVNTRDICAAAQAHVPALRAAGADIVIALCHAGLGAEAHTPGMENATIPLAAVPGIDVILAGHTHQIFPDPDRMNTGAVNAQTGTLHGKPAVMAGCHGSHLGLIDLNITHGPTGWTITHHHSSLRAIDAANPAVDPTIAAAITPLHDRALAHIRTPLARTKTPLFSQFAMVAPAASLTLMSDAMRAFAHEVLTDAQRQMPLLTAVAPYKAGGGAADNVVDVPAGPLAIRHTAELYPFPNTLCLLSITGADIHRWLEVSALGFHQIQPGTHGQPLINTAVPSYCFDVLYGLHYDIDVSQPAGRRIRALRLADGRALAPKSSVILATNSYRAGGGGGFDMARNGILLDLDRPALHEVLIRYLSQTKTVAPLADRVWRFSPLPGTSAWFDAGAGAADHLSNPLHHHLRDTTERTNGYGRYTYHFDPS